MENPDRESGASTIETSSDTVEEELLAMITRFTDVFYAAPDQIKSAFHDICKEIDRLSTASEDLLGADPEALQLADQLRERVAAVMDDSAGNRMHDQVVQSLQLVGGRTLEAAAAKRRLRDLCTLPTGGNNPYKTLLSTYGQYRCDERFVTGTRNVEEPTDKVIADMKRDRDALIASLYAVARAYGFDVQSGEKGDQERIEI